MSVAALISMVWSYTAKLAILIWAQHKKTWKWNKKFQNNEEISEENKENKEEKFQNNEAIWPLILVFEGVI